MSDNQKELEPETRRVKVTAFVSLKAYETLNQIQQQYRRRTGEHIPLWKVLDAAILAYEKQHGIRD